MTFKLLSFSHLRQFKHAFVYLFVAAAEFRETLFHMVFGVCGGKAGGFSVPWSLVVDLTIMPRWRY